MTDNTPSLSGQFLGAYEIQAKVGVGGMGAVYRAYHPATDRQVAIKVMTAPDNRDYVRRFEQEARLVASLQHIHILPVYDYGEAHGTLYIVMPYVSTGTLKDVVRGRKTPLSVDAAVRLMAQLCEAVGFAHQKGVLHRDLKPANVLLDESQNVRLADFGLARVTSSSNSLTGERLVGTPIYMSPEQGQGMEVDQRTDIYALGVILYEMLAGQVPFRADSPITVILKHMTDPVPPIERAGLPASILDVAMRALEKQPKDRFGSAGEMGQVLTRALLLATSTPTQPEPPSIVVEPPMPKEATSPSSPFKSLREFDVKAEIARYFQFAQDENWLNALECLHGIKASGKAPNAFRIDEYLAKTQAAYDAVINRKKSKQEQAAQEYEVIKLMAQHESEERVWETLQAFWQAFPGYDPDHLRDDFRPLPPQLKEQVDVIKSPTTTPMLRAQAGRNLAAVGDPRKGVGVNQKGLPDIHWMKIEAGAFTYQRGEQEYLGNYYISKYPITYAQYAAFVNSGGYTNDAYWTEVGLAWRKDFREPRIHWNDLAFHIPNHPVIGISWFEAVAFCHWMTANTPRKSRRVVRLPTEVEWEKAARGIDGRMYPWGNDLRSGCANVDEVKKKNGQFYLDRTSAVGIYPQGVSPYGVMDMCGNVWEWCINTFAPTSSFQSSGNEERALRGSGWLVTLPAAVITARFKLTPNTRLNFVGFRVVAANLVNA